MPTHAEQVLAALPMVALRVKYRPLTQTRIPVSPSDYALDHLKLNLWSKQREIADAVADHKRVLVQSANGIGKSFLAGAITNWWFDTHRPSIALTTAPTWTQTYEVLWAEISRQRREANIASPWTAHYRGIGVQLRDSDSHYATAHNAESGEAFKGRHEEEVLIVLDEGPGVPQYIWDAADTMLQSDKCRILVLGNPTDLSGAYWKAAHDPSWRVVHVSALEHPNIAAELKGETAPYLRAVRLSWVREQIEAHCERILETVENDDSFEFEEQWYRPDDIFRVTVLGLFPKQASSSVWDEAWVLNARDLHTERLLGVVEIGCDVARFGDDETTIAVRWGNTLLYVLAFAKQDTMQTANRLVNVANELGALREVNGRQIPIKVDDSGLGGGVTDRLRELRYRVIGVDAATKANDPEHYPNRRSEIWFATAQRAKEGRLDLSRLSEREYNRLRTDLLAPKFKMDSQGRRVVEPKDEMKKRIGRSPDYGDAVNLVFYGAGTQGGAVVIGKAEPEQRSLVQRNGRSAIVVHR